MVNLIDLGPRKDETHILVNPSDTNEGIAEFLKLELEKDLPEKTRLAVTKTLAKLEA